MRIRSGLSDVLVRDSHEASQVAAKGWPEAAQARWGVLWCQMKRSQRQDLRSMENTARLKRSPIKIYIYVYIYIFFKTISICANEGVKDHVRSSWLSVVRLFGSSAQPKANCWSSWAPLSLAPASWKLCAMPPAKSSRKRCAKSCRQRGFSWKMP